MAATANGVPANHNSDPVKQVVAPLTLYRSRPINHIMFGHQEQDSSLQLFRSRPPFIDASPCKKLAQKLNITEPEQTGMSEEKVEMSEVPLTADTEKPADSEQKPETEEKKEEKTSKPSRFRNFFSRERSGERKEKETPKDADGTDMESEEKKTEEVKPTKTPRKWFVRKPKEHIENGPDARAEDHEMTIGLNLLDRDEKNLNEHVKLSFEDVFAEPDGYHSFDCAWRLTHRVFVGTRSFLYRLLALIFALPCAIFWGIVFGLLTVLNIWACVPLARFLTIPATWLAKVWNFFVRSVMDPLFRSCGLCFSSVTIRKYGIPADTSMDAAHIA